MRLAGDAPPRPSSLLNTDSRLKPLPPPPRPPSIRSSAQGGSHSTAAVPKM